MFAGQVTTSTLSSHRLESVLCGRFPVPIPQVATGSLRFSSGSLCRNHSRTRSVARLSWVKCSEGIVYIFCMDICIDSLISMDLIGFVWYIVRCIFGNLFGKTANKFFVQAWQNMTFFETRVERLEDRAVDHALQLCWPHWPAQLIFNDFQHPHVLKNRFMDGWKKLLYISSIFSSNRSFQGIAWPALGLCPSRHTRHEYRHQCVQDRRQLAAGDWIPRERHAAMGMPV